MSTEKLDIINLRSKTIDLMTIQKKSEYIHKSECIQFDNYISEFLINNLFLFWIVIIILYEISKNVFTYLFFKLIKWKKKSNTL